MQLINFKDFTLKKKKVFTFFFFFIFFISISNLYSNTLYKTLDRTILSDYNYSTEHFDIYWSFDDDYFLNNNLANNNWKPKDIDINLPDFVYQIQDKLEKLYTKFNNDNLLLASKIKVYILNTNIKATDPNLTVNSISSWGAFTSDDYPEILINSYISKEYNNKEYNYKEFLKSKLAHEMMHAVQYQNNIIHGADDAPDSDKWFTEGTAVVTETYMMNDPKYLYEYFDNIINIEGFKSTNNYAPYGNGFLFYYLMKKYNYTLNDFIERYKLYPTFDTFISSIENEQNLKHNELITDIYNSFLYEKSLYGEGFKDIDIGYTDFTNYTLNVKNGWQLISLPLDINNFDIFKDIDYTIWGYKNNKWSCITSTIEKNKICEKNKMLLKSISKKDGFWLKSDKVMEINLEIFK